MPPGLAHFAPTTPTPSPSPSPTPRGLDYVVAHHPTAAATHCPHVPSHPCTHPRRRGLDYVVAAAQRRGMRVILALGNVWCAAVCVCLLLALRVCLVV